MQTPDWLPEYGAVALATFFGSFANGPRWRDSSGRFSRAQFLTEGAAVVGLTIALVGMADYAQGIVDTKVLCAIGVMFGWLGPQPVAAWVLEKLGIRSHP